MTPGSYLEDINTLAEWCVVNSQLLNVSKPRGLIVEKKAKTHTPVNISGVRGYQVNR